MTRSVLLAVILAISATAGGRFVSHDPLTHTKQSKMFGIFKANESDIESYPYTISVYSKLYDSRIGSGAILNNYWILVTAYEVSGQVADDLIVRAGSNCSYNGGQEYGVSKIAVYEYYVKGNQYNRDIALLKTDSEILFSDSVKRINLSYYTPKTYTTAVISGFGANEEEDGLLRSASVIVLSNNKCQQYLYLAASMMCSVSNTSAPAALDDFGSPLVQDNVLIGSFLGRYKDGPSIYNNIIEWNDWIVDTIKKYT